MTKRTGSNTSATPVYGSTTDPVTGNTTQSVVGLSYSSGTGTYYTTTETYPVYTYHPAVSGVEGVEATTTVDNQPGWNAGAQSVDTVSGDFAVSFDLPASTLGALVGLVEPGSTVGSYAAVQHGLLLTTTNGHISVVESGVEVATGPTVADTYVCEMRRVGGVVTYSVGDWSYTSTTTSTGTKTLAAVLYSAPDYVDNPTLSTVISLPVSMDWGWAEQGLTSLPVRATWGWSGTATMGDGFVTESIGLSMSAGDSDYGEVRFTLDVPTVDSAFGFATVDVSGFNAKFEFGLAAQGIEIGIGSVSDTFDLTMQAADHDYGEARVLLDGPDTWALSTEEPTDQADITEVVSMTSVIASDAVLIALLSDSLTVGDSFDVLFGVQADAADSLALYDDIDVRAIFEATLSNTLRLNDSASSIATTLLQYATNLLTGAVSRYDGYDFTGFCRADTYTYGIRKDGLYQLDGDTDNGELISALLDMAAEDFGNPARKRIDAIYLGLNTDGEVYVRLTDDQDRQMTYKAFQRRDLHRVNTALGISSRFWRMRLEITEASVADLDQIEWLPVANGRLIKK
ncbi:hypothetical protein HAQ04_25530 [Pseudomonas sp. C2L11]|nr:hypothetical protein [Pseudomonas typographi]